ncbi:MAG: hypothetical protein QOD94_3343 [Alphaproteobacteria bacterium]|jgi:hypothetical protein|nr:hypothetical protein [Alphaproteobacteria bacterium]
MIGYVVLAGGITSTAQDIVSRIMFSAPLNMGIVIGNGALLLLALVTLLAAKYFKILEDRLSKLEGPQS